MDFTYANHGTIILLQPHTPEAAGWIDANCDVPPWAYLGSNVTVAPREFLTLVEAIANAGLTIQSETRPH